MSSERLQKLNFVNFEAQKDRKSKFWKIETYIECNSLIF